MTPPLVSVHMVTYNHVKYIRQAIESVLNQKVSFNYEIVIGDDGSNDGTTGIVLEYANRYPEKIKSVTSEKNEGFLKNWKKVYDHCNGKYFAHCEGDDYWHNPDRLQLQADFLEKHPEYGLAHGDLNYHYEKNNKLIVAYNKQHNITFPDGEIFDYVMNPFNRSMKNIASMFRKSIIDANFDFNVALEKEWKTLDLPLWLIVTKYSKAKYFDEPLGTFRILMDSTSNTLNQQKKYKFHESIFSIYSHYANHFNCSAACINSIQLFFWRARLKDAFFMEDRELIKKSKRELVRLEHKPSTFELAIFLLSLFPVIHKFFVALFFSIKAR